MNGSAMGKALIGAHINQTSGNTIISLTPAISSIVLLLTEMPFFEVCNSRIK